jgi:hypothetical protein
MTSERVVVSLSTIPSRAKYVSEAVARLLAQSAAVSELLVHCLKPPALPAHPAVKILYGPDYGPGTKLLGALEYLGNEDALIVTVDDDVIYHPRLIETLVAGADADPAAALGFRGWLLDRRSEIALPGDYRLHPEVDVLEGWSGAIYRRCFFEPGVSQAFRRCPSCFWADDVWISGYLAERGISRRLLTTREEALRFPRCSPASAVDGLKDHPQNRERNRACARSFEFGGSGKRPPATAWSLPRVRRTLSA